MNLSFPIKQRFFDSNGLPLVGGKLYSYVAGTSVPIATYSNSTGTTNANPIILDSQGYCDLWLDPTLAYKFILQDSSSVQQWSIDNVTYYTGLSTWNANTTYAQNQVVVDSSTGLFYVSLINNNQNNALTVVSAWRASGGNIRTVSTSSTLLVSDELVLSNSASGNLTHTLPACSTTPVGKKITIKDVGSAGNYTLVKGNGTDTVDGSVTWGTNLIQYVSVTVENTGSAWDIVTGFAVPDGSVTTAKLADVSVTRAKRIALGKTISTYGSSSFRTQSSTAVDVVDGVAGTHPITATITTTGGDVEVSLIPNTSGSMVMVDSASNGAATGEILFYRDATLLNIQQLKTNTLNGTENIYVGVPPGSFNFVDDGNGSGLAAGTYVYKIQALVFGAAGTMGISVQECKLGVRERF